MPNRVEVESFARPSDPPVRGYLHRPEAANGNALILTHGAGSNAQAPLLVALAETFSAHGFIVLRCNLPFRQMRSFGPPGPADAARDRVGLKNAVIAIQNVMGAPLLPAVGRSGDFDSSITTETAESRQRQRTESNTRGKIFLGGHSYGGRQSSMLCAEEPNLVAGLLLLSYPLHTPRKPEQQRTQHLPDLRTPTLFIHGTRDPFGSIEELQKAIKMIPAQAKLLPVEWAGHDLGFKGKAKKEDLVELVFSEFREFFELSS